MFKTHGIIPYVITKILTDIFVGYKWCSFFQRNNSYEKDFRYFIGIYCGVFNFNLNISHANLVKIYLTHEKLVVQLI